MLTVVLCFHFIVHIIYLTFDYFNSFNLNKEKSKKRNSTNIVKPVGKIRKDMSVKNNKQKTKGMFLTKGSFFTQFKLCYFYKLYYAYLILYFSHKRWWQKQGLDWQERER